MTFIRAPESQVCLDRDHIKLSISADVFLKHVHGDTSFTAVTKSLAQRSKAFHSSYSVSFQEPAVADSARNLVSSRSFQGTVESCYRSYVCITKLMRRVQKAMRLVEKLSDEDTGEDFSATRGVLAATDLDNAIFSSANEHEVLRYIETAAAGTRGLKHIVTFNSRAF